VAEEPTASDAGAIRVLIADDHALFRRGLNMVLESEGGIEVVAEAEDGVDALVKAEEFAPDVVLMDVRMPRLSGIEACRSVREVVPSAKILMLTVSDEEDDLFEAMKAGAAGYLLKEISIDEVGKSVRGVHHGQRLVTPSLATKLITEFAGMPGRHAARGVEIPQLTPRELEVLRHVADGATNRGVASRLGISGNTVKNHVRNILEKLRLHSRMEAVLYAMRERLLDLP
jgi:two-component system NarL family response regulator